MLRRLLTCLLLSCFIPLPVAHGAEAVPKILVIESYNKEYGWDASYRRALTHRLSDKYTLSYFEMDTKRLPKDQHEARADLAWQTYLEEKPDLVVLGDDAALQFLAERFAQTTTPVVYLGINRNPRVYIPANAKNFTGVLERPLLKRSIVFIKELIPSVKNVLVIFDGNLSSEIVKKEVFDNNDTITFYGVRVDVLRLSTLAQWSETLAKAKENGYQAIVFGLFQTVVDDNNRYVEPEKLVRWASDNTPVPPFAFWDFAVGAHKALGGLVLSGYEIGEEAAKIVIDILENKTRPADIQPVYNNEGHLMFSARQLDKWKIKLPAHIQAVATVMDDK